MFGSSTKHIKHRIGTKPGLPYLSTFLSHIRSVVRCRLHLSVALVTDVKPFRVDSFLLITAILSVSQCFCFLWCSVVPAEGNLGCVLPCIRTIFWGLWSPVSCPRPQTAPQPWLKEGTATRRTQRYPPTPTPNCSLSLLLFQLQDVPNNLAPFQKKKKRHWCSF